MSDKAVAVVAEHARLVHSLAARGLSMAVIAATTGLPIAVVREMLARRRR